MREGNKWKEIPIHNLGRIVTGSTPPTKRSELFGDKYPFITPSDIDGSSRYPVTKRFLSEEGYKHQKSRLLPPKSVCFTSIGATIGKLCMTDAPSFTNQQINNIIVDEANFDNFFVYYLLKNDVERIKGLAGGAATPIINKTVFSNVIVQVPPLKVQREIASILSAYDDLIENNTRRIKILEEMAQSLYREWFINFRFPGHEKTKFIDSPLGKIPGGWEVTKLGEHLDDLESGKRPKGGAKDLPSGVPSVGAENVVGIGKHNYLSEKYVPRDFFERMKKGIVRNGDVALYKDGAYIGRSTYFRDGFPHSEFCVNEHVFLLRSRGPRLSQNLLYIWTQEPSTISAVRATNANAAQPGINQSGLKKLEMLLPTSDIAKQFDYLTDPYFGLIVRLAKKNKSLRRTRDLLLPKLITGEIDVNNMPAAAL